MCKLFLVPLKLLGITEQIFQLEQMDKLSLIWILDVKLLYVSEQIPVNS